MKNAKLSQPNGLPVTLVIHGDQLIHRGLFHRTPQMEHFVDSNEPHLFEKKAALEVKQNHPLCRTYFS